MRTQLNRHDAAQTTEQRHTNLLGPSPMAERQTSQGTRMPTNILVVDDNKVYRDSFCDMLQECFAQVQIVPTNDGISALGLTHKIAFDLIILDYELTTISGSDVVRRLRARGQPLPPIVLMSAHSDIAVFARLLRVNACLHKPVSFEDMRAVLTPFIEQPQQLRSGPHLWK
jgi:CheY-like chemotaxis protein